MKKLKEDDKLTKQSSLGHDSPNLVFNIDVSK